MRQCIRTVMQYGMAHGWVETNPAGEAIDGALLWMPKVKNHQRALPYSEVPAALDKVAQTQASEASKLCLRFLVLTAVRSGEAALAHVVGNSVEAAYVRTDLFDQRRHLMQDWANYVAP